MKSSKKPFLITIDTNDSQDDELKNTKLIAKEKKAENDVIVKEVMENEKSISNTTQRKGMSKKKSFLEGIDLLDIATPNLDENINYELEIEVETNNDKDIIISPVNIETTSNADESFESVLVLNPEEDVKEFYNEYDLNQQSIKYLDHYAEFKNFENYLYATLKYDNEDDPCKAREYCDAAIDLMESTKSFQSSVENDKYLGNCIFINRILSNLMKKSFRGSSITHAKITPPYRYESTTTLFSYMAMFSRNGNNRSLLVSWFNRKDSNGQYNIEHYLECLERTSLSNRHTLDDMMNISKEIIPFLSFSPQVFSVAIKKIYEIRIKKCLTGETVIKNNWDEILEMIFQHVNLPGNEIFDIEVEISTLPIIFSTNEYIYMPKNKRHPYYIAPVLSYENKKRHQLFKKYTHIEKENIIKQNMICTTYLAAVSSLIDNICHDVNNIKIDELVEENIQNVQNARGIVNKIKLLILMLERSLKFEIMPSKTYFMQIHSLIMEKDVYSPDIECKTFEKKLEQEFKKELLNKLENNVHINLFNKILNMIEIIGRLYKKLNIHHYIKLGPNKLIIFSLLEFVCALMEDIAVISHCDGVCKYVKYYMQNRNNIDFKQGPFETFAHGFSDQDSMIFNGEDYNKISYIIFVQILKKIQFNDIANNSLNWLLAIERYNINFINNQKVTGNKNILNNSISSSISNAVQILQIISAYTGRYQLKPTVVSNLIECIEPQKKQFISSSDVILRRKINNALYTFAFDCLESATLQNCMEDRYKDLVRILIDTIRNKSLKVKDFRDLNQNIDEEKINEFIKEFINEVILPVYKEQEKNRKSMYKENKIQSEKDSNNNNLDKDKQNDITKSLSVLHTTLNNIIDEVIKDSLQLSFINGIEYAFINYGVVGSHRSGSVPIILNAIKRWYLTFLPNIKNQCFIHGTLLPYINQPLVKTIGNKIENFSIRSLKEPITFNNICKIFDSVNTTVENDKIFEESKEAEVVNDEDEYYDTSDEKEENNVNNFGSKLLFNQKNKNVQDEKAGYSQTFFLTGLNNNSHLDRNTDYNLVVSQPTPKSVNRGFGFNSIDGIVSISTYDLDIVGSDTKTQRATKHLLNSKDQSALFVSNPNDAFSINNECSIISNNHNVSSETNIVFSSTPQVDGNEKNSKLIYDETKVKIWNYDNLVCGDKLTDSIKNTLTEDVEANMVKLFKQVLMPYKKAKEIVSDFRYLLIDLIQKDEIKKIYIEKVTEKICEEFLKFYANSKIDIDSLKENKIYNQINIFFAKCYGVITPRFLFEYLKGVCPVDGIIQSMKNKLIEWDAMDPSDYTNTEKKDIVLAYNLVADVNNSYQINKFPLFSDKNL